MKKQFTKVIQAGIPVLLTLFFLLAKLKPDLFPELLSFPLKQIGDGLLALSESGSMGNGLAIALGVGLAMIPALVALGYQKGKETLAERGSLFLLSATMLAALYGMINPAPFQSLRVPGFSNETIRAEAFGISCWAVLVLFFILRFIRLMSQSNKTQIFGYLKTILRVLGIILGLVIIYCVVAYVVEISSWAEQDGVIPLELTLADKCLRLVWLTAPLVSYILDLLIVMKLEKLVSLAGADSQEGLVPVAQGVSRLCCLALGVTAALVAAANIIQMMLMRWLSSTNFTVNFPILSIIFTIMIFVFTRILIENKRLREDNELFI